MVRSPAGSSADRFVRFQHPRCPQNGQKAGSDQSTGLVSSAKNKATGAQRSLARFLLLFTGQLHDRTALLTCTLQRAGLPPGRLSALPPGMALPSHLLSGLLRTMVSAAPGANRPDNLSYPAAQPLFADPLESGALNQALQLPAVGQVGDRTRQIGVGGGV